MGILRSVWARWPRPRGRPGPAAAGPALSWIGDERIAISGVPPAWAVARLAEQGVTHVVNCRPRAQVRRYGDLAAEQAAFGPGQVAHAPMRDHGRRQRPAAWAAAAFFAVRVLENQPQSAVLIHCSAGRRRSAMLAHAVRLHGHDRTRAAALVLTYRTEAELVPGLCAERRAVARHSGPVTSATAMLGLSTRIGAHTRYGAAVSGRRDATHVAPRGLICALPRTRRNC
jgi:protein-tyrosine phosphatase